jgi:hypothetical protein
VKVKIDIAERLAYLGLPPTGNLDEQMIQLDVRDKLHLDYAYLSSVEAKNPETGEIIKDGEPIDTFNYNPLLDKFEADLNGQERKTMVKLIQLHGKKIKDDFPTALVTLLRKIR